MTSSYTAAPTKDRLLKNGKPFFYLADTVWSAFTKAPMDEWEDYLSFRAAQGFNALQINILPQWDASTPHMDIYPFKRTAHGVDPYRYDDAYFKRASDMTAMAVRYGFLPALVLLWGNYAKGNWCSEMRPADNLPFDAVAPYASFAADVFGEFDPLYIISGDTNFNTADASRWYLSALDTVKERSPTSLATMHIGGALSVLPNELIDSPMDLYLYQSGHGAGNQHCAYTIPEKFASLAVKRPMINAEACYEGHKCGRESTARFSRSDVRRAAWQSVLAGAKAGMTYGAHGIWGWHRRGDIFKNDFSGPAFEWSTALRFPGASDYAFMKDIILTHGLFDCVPANDRIEAVDAGVRFAASARTSALYIPYPFEVTVREDLSSCSISAIDLETRETHTPPVSFADGKTVFGMPAYNADTLILIHR